jgi:hypothetical protein
MIHPSIPIRPAVRQYTQPELTAKRQALRAAEKINYPELRRIWVRIQGAASVGISGYSLLAATPKTGQETSKSG